MPIYDDLVNLIESSEMSDASRNNSLQQLLATANPAEFRATAVGLFKQGTPAITEASLPDGLILQLRYKIKERDMLRALWSRRNDDDFYDFLRAEAVKSLEVIKGEFTCNDRVAVSYLERVRYTNDQYQALLKNEGVGHTDSITEKTNTSAQTAQELKDQIDGIPRGLLIKEINEKETELNRAKALQSSAKDKKYPKNWFTASEQIDASVSRLTAERDELIRRKEEFLRTSLLTEQAAKRTLTKKESALHLINQSNQKLSGALKEGKLAFEEYLASTSSSKEAVAKKKIDAAKDKAQGIGVVLERTRVDVRTAVISANTFTYANFTLQVKDAQGLTDEVMTRQEALEKVKELTGKTPGVMGSTVVPEDGEASKTIGVALRGDSAVKLATNSKGSKHFFMLQDESNKVEDITPTGTLNADNPQDLEVLQWAAYKQAEMYLEKYPAGKKILIEGGTPEQATRIYAAILLLGKSKRFKEQYGKELSRDDIECLVAGATHPARYYLLDYQFISAKLDKIVPAVKARSKSEFLAAQLALKSQNKALRDETQADQGTIQKDTTATEADAATTLIVGEEIHSKKRFNP